MTPTSSMGASGPAEVLYPHFGITAFARVGGRRQMSMAVSLQRWNELDSAGKPRPRAIVPGSKIDRVATPPCAASSCRTLAFTGDTAWPSNGSSPQMV